MRHLTTALVLGALAMTSACGGEVPLVGDFTSEVVQRNSCRLVGDDDRERCVRDEVITTQRVTLREDDFDRVWIIGLTVEGENDRRVLGTRDSEGGFLFDYETRQVNSDTGCTLTTQLLLSLAIDSGVAEERIGADPCVPLLGRETRRSITSAACDTVNVPPARIERISRRRWEPSPTCGDE
jgi:hypothetical protein